MRAVVSQASNKPAHWWQRHPKATGLIVGGGVGFGLVFAFMRPAHCASTYDGKPYFGTPPCPK